VGEPIGCNNTGIADAKNIMLGIITLDGIRGSILEV